MGTTAQKLAKLQETKASIKTAIINKGVEIPSNAAFSSYGTYIDSIATGGGGITPSGDIEIQKQSGTDVTDYATASVKSGSEGIPTATKGSVSNNQISVTPSVANTSGWINGGTKTGTAVTVKASDLVSGNIQLSASANTNVTNYATASVKSGSAGTPVANKGTVSNNQVVITPTVSNSEGWIPGSSKTGSTVTVKASDLVGGTKSVTAGTSTTTSDVTNYASVSIAPTPSETKTVTANGTVTPSSGKLLSSVVVNISYKTYRTGSGEPSSSLGNDGDVYFDIS